MHFARIVTPLLFVSIVACGSKGKGPNAGDGSKEDVAVDTAACSNICDASAACGEETGVCIAKCREWLVKRSRPGIARATAQCAIPRIDAACAADASKGAARALVACVDEAGRAALKSDKAALLVAARAICERGARCSGATSKDALRCVQRITTMNPTPRGLGIFGAIKPEHVDQFASCMQATACGEQGSASHCFAEMLGENPSIDPETPEEGGGGPEQPQPQPDPGAGGTKI